MEILYALFTAIFCTGRFWGIDVEWYISVGVRILIIGLFLVFHKFRFKRNYIIEKNLKLATVPIIAIVVYSIAVWLMSGSVPDEDVVRNLFTANTYLVISYLFASVLYYEFGKNSIVFLMKCGVVSYLLGSILPLIIKMPRAAISYLFTSHTNDTSLLWLTEVNDLTFAFGIILLYFLFSYHQNHKKKNIIICALMIFWGLKRIEIAAILLCYLFFKVITEKIVFSQGAKIFLVSVLSVSYLYVMFIHNGQLAMLAEMYNINFMGRLLTYNYVTETYSSFSPGFLGIGFGRIDEILDDLVAENFRINYVPVISLHSDVLRMYIGLGFIAFGIWIFYQCYYRTMKLKKYFGSKTAQIYICLTLYIFILYLTDNTYSYPITGATYFLAILCVSDENHFNAYLNKERAK
ncbi:TPA: glycerol-3-phosphate cytidylyltransferase [Enterococcus faecium]|nr:glycerol-3-phosphate cytidylyltransferase [Enterococcus faecium]HAR1794785.1 glycerol-3-phosphate cytidylyltransferase [Enterococcus faecium]HAR1799586.1 glycerol-3-phosphate cytidylyltransferase [Enterococcus faecium]HAR1803546.1 glycerol-3-phosphate cytidylyltransferase [Enterococcus faecium]HAR1806483.1 glycerol-3-phosphate cytidylyltransferase [Enterococcus faecium]